MTQIGLLVAFALMLLAFLESGPKGRVVIVAVLLITIILPRIFSFSTAIEVACTVVRLLFAACCCIFLRYRKAV